MSTFFTTMVFGVFSLLVLWMIAVTAREVSARLKAGPTRFRLPLASPARPPRGSRAATVVLIMCALACLPAAVMSATDSSMSVLPLLYIWIVVNNRQMTNPRRDARRWLVLAAGLLALAIGTILMAAGFRSLLAGRALYGMPAWFPFFWSLTLFVPGAMALDECISGTRVREGGIQMLGSVRPWSLVAVKDWQEREGGFAVRLAILSPWRYGMPYRRGSEIIVPVPASERPALEVFLAGHAATAEGSLACEDVPDLSEITWIRDEAKR